MLKNKQLLCFIVVGLIVYLVYTNNLLSVFFSKKTSTTKSTDDKVINVSIENFQPKPVKFETKESKFYKTKLDKIQETNSKEHKEGALYLKHAVSDVFDLEKTPEELARWKKYYKSKHGGLPKIDKSSGEYFKNSCYPTLKYDGIHRI